MEPSITVKKATPNNLVYAIDTQGGGAPTVFDLPLTEIRFELRHSIGR